MHKPQVLLIPHLVATLGANTLDPVMALDLTSFSQSFENGLSLSLRLGAAATTTNQLPASRNKRRNRPILCGPWLVRLLAGPSGLYLRARHNEHSTTTAVARYALSLVGCDVGLVSELAPVRGRQVLSLGYRQRSSDSHMTRSGCSLRR